MAAKGSGSSSCSKIISKTIPVVGSEAPQLDWQSVGSERVRLTAWASPDTDIKTKPTVNKVLNFFRHRFIAMIIRHMLLSGTLRGNHGSRK